MPGAPLELAKSPQLIIAHPIDILAPELILPLSNNILVDQFGCSLPLDEIVGKESGQDLTLALDSVPTGSVVWLNLPAHLQRRQGQDFAA